MGVLGALLTALVPSLVEGVKGLWEKYGQALVARWDGMRDQKLRDEKATLEATTEVQRNVLDAKAQLADQRAKTPERLSNDWWSKGAGIVVLAALLSGCAMLARPPLPVAPVRVTLDRPAFPALTETQQAWLSALVLAAEENCTALAVIGGQSPKAAVGLCTIR